MIIQLRNTFLCVRGGAFIMEEYKYEVALSFASEQRDYVYEVAEQLSLLGVRVFYDDYEKVDLWGKNLLKYFEEVFYKKSHYCVMFISKEYKEKYWTKYESETIEERNFYQNSEENFQQYILPVRFDSTKIPGIRDTWGYISAQEIVPAELGKMIYEKVRGEKYHSQTSRQMLNLNEIYIDITSKLPQDFISKAIKKSVLQQKTDAILLFDNNCLQSEFVYYDGKIFLDSTNKMWVLNLGFFNNSQVLYETTLEQLRKEFLAKVDNSL